MKVKRNLPINPWRWSLLLLQYTDIFTNYSQQKNENPLATSGLSITDRKDQWWVRPLLVFLGLMAFIVYATWAALQGDNYYLGNYLSPFYSPEIFGMSPHSWFGAVPAWWPGVIPFSPAYLILWAPGGFRATCYYYRGTYYRSFWADPVACGVKEPRNTYWGENTFPLILQNAHRYFLYFAILLVFILAYDAWKAFWFINPDGTENFGFAIGTLVLIINPILLGSYTFGCHSFRHLVGGIKDQLSKAPVRKKFYFCATCLNKDHQLWAWCSAFWVAFTDLYIRLCAMGVWVDWRIF